MPIATELNPLVIRTMTAEDMEVALAWAEQEGWNPGLSDAALFARVDLDGCLVASDDSGPVAVLAVPRYDAAFAFLGLFIVRPDRRGCGYGRAIWQAGLRYAEGRTVGLDGVLAMQPSYRRSGFETGHRNLRFSGVPSGMPAPEAGIGAWDGNLAELADFDACHFPARRDAFLQSWLTAPNHRVRIARQQGRIVGYGVARPCRVGFKVAPLFAQTPEVADGLFGALVAACGRTVAITLDVPEPNRAAMCLAARVGLHPVFETARMYHGLAPELSLARIFGITSLELG